MITTSYSILEIAREEHKRFWKTWQSGLSFQNLLAVEGLMHLAPACTLWLLLGVSIVEWPAMQREGALELMRAKPLLYLSAAAMGFLVNSLAYVVIQTANSLTLKVLGTVKNALVVWISVVFIGEIITGMQVTPQHP